MKEAEAHMQDRLAKLQAMLAKEPDDAFLLYGLAMEYKKLGEHAKAIEHFDRVLARDPGYCYAYHQKGLVYEDLSDLDAAKRSYREGIEAAARKGDLHAKEEIAAALSMIE